MTVLFKFLYIFISYSWHSCSHVHIEKINRSTLIKIKIRIDHGINILGDLILKKGAKMKKKKTDRKEPYLCTT
jgi:hypothetical protein